MAENLTLVKRDIAWTNQFSVIYIDNPVGVGFSFSNNASAFVTNEQQVGEDLFNFADIFFKVFPRWAKNDFFITGESYAGKYVPAFAHETLRQIEAGKSTINLKGDGAGQLLQLNLRVLAYSGQLDVILGAPLCL